MFTKEVGKDYLILKEISYGVLFRSVIIFLAALTITINAKNTSSVSITGLFLTGPLLMALSFVYVVFFFKKITITIGLDEIVRYTWGVNGKKEESLSLSGVSSLEILPGSASIYGFFTQTKYDIFLKFENDVVTKLNTKGMSIRKASKICTTICTLLLIPYNKTKKESLIKTLSSLKEIIK